MKPVLQNFKLTLEYDGSAFSGFQLQPGRATVQKALEEALSKLFDTPVKIKSASGRTDTGVHAQGQVVNVVVCTRLKLSQILRGLNRYLPPEVAVVKVGKVPLDFHARFHAKRKCYEYRIWNSPVRSPLHARSSAHIPYPLDIKPMKAAAKILIGKHDFRSFCAVDHSRKDQDTVRTLYRFEIRKSGPLIRLVLEADGFLYYMVRNLVGTLVEVGRGKLSLKAIQEILNAKDRRTAGMTAPAHGLCLKHVTY